MDTENIVLKYLMMTSTAIQKMELEDINEIVEVLRNAETIYIAGNGGSAANALHMALDLRKCANLNTICLNGNNPIITAYANDDGYESIFVNQLNHASRRDVFVGISCSGNSLNILRAIRKAKEVFKMPTIGFTGNEGGKLAEEADYIVKVPFEYIRVHEDAHSALLHAITLALEK